MVNTLQMFYRAPSGLSLRVEDKMPTRRDRSKTVRHQWGNALAAFVFLPLVTACVIFTPQVGRDSPAEADSGYIYGRFTLTTPESSSLGGGLVKMGLVVADTRTGLPYTIQFLRSRQISVVAVRPGTYTLSKLAFGGANSETMGEETLTHEKLTKEFRVEPGKVYYIGDFLGLTNRPSIFSKVDWSLQSIRNNYEATTRDFKQRFPKFQNVESVSASYEYP